MAKRVGILLCYPFEERRILNQGQFHLTWQPPYLVQPKLNGERCRMIVIGGRCLLLSSSEDIIPAVPHLNHYGLQLPDGEYDGELYVHGWTWAEIHSVVSREQNLHPKSAEMKFHIFDLINSDPQYKRIQTLAKIFQHSTPQCFEFVKSSIAYSLEDLYKLYDRYISKGYEGFIVRHMTANYRRRRSPAIMKFKPKSTDHYLITSVYEAISEDGTPKGMVGGFNCIDEMHTPFSVGAGKLPHDDRRDLWARWLDAPTDFIGKLLEVEYQTMSDKARVPLFSRAVKVLF